MHQANLISRPVARNPSYHTIVDQFMAALGSHSEQNKIEQQCLTFFQILYDIGGPLKNASETMKKELVQNVKSMLNIDLNLRAFQSGQRDGSFNNGKSISQKQFNTTDLRTYSVCIICDMLF